MKLEYEFKDKSLLELALTQSGADGAHNNERLEFVGDRVLGLTVAEMLYNMFPNETEGELARRHATLVSTETLAVVANMLGLESRVRHGHMTGGRIQHVLANAMEAILGAIFLESGFEVARKIISDIWYDLAKRDITAPKDPKTALQEFVQANASGALPVYSYEEKTVRNTQKFVATVSALGHSASGTGLSKKEASINAASELMKILAI